MNRYVNIALRLSSKSNHRIHKMCALLIKGGAIVSVGINDSRWGHHAEKHALHGLPDNVGGTLVVARKGNRMSRPCDKCLELIKSKGVEKIVYTNWEGKPVLERVV